jgi:predicted HD superfamily hydrolase involved in NAD metabolism
MRAARRSTISTSISWAAGDSVRRDELIYDAVIGSLRQAVERLPDGLRDHVLNVEREAISLGQAHGLSPDRVRIAVLGHDLARHEPPDRLLELACRHSLDPDDVERASPILVHGPVAARLLESEYGVTDADVLAAAASHTTARPGMSTLEKVIFLADKFDPEKLDRRPECRPLADLARTHLDAALLRFLDLHIRHALDQGWLIHPRTLSARNSLLMASGDSQA